jgi:hypothetical protein
LRHDAASRAEFFTLIAAPEQPAARSMSLTSR